jgi:hypothetical protein
VVVMSAVSRLRSLAASTRSSALSSSPSTKLRKKGWLKLPGFRGHFSLCGEGSTNGQKTSSCLPAGVPG